MYRQYGKLKAAEKKYIKENPHHIPAIIESKSTAYTETKARFGYNGHKDKTDAFRHCFWSAVLSRDIGYENAIKFTTAHENFPDNPKHEKEMDLHNNKAGARLGLSKADNEKLSSYCNSKLLSGNLKVIKVEDGQ